MSLSSHISEWSFYTSLYQYKGINMYKKQQQPIIGLVQTNDDLKLKCIVSLSNTYMYKVVSEWKFSQQLL